jgi:hypothetical protein
VIAHWLVLPVEKVATKVQSLGFISISIEMAKIVVGSPSLTQPLLLYLGLGPAMLEQHRRSYIYVTCTLSIIEDHFPLLSHIILNYIITLE